MILLLFFLFIALFVSFLCSIMEAVLLSTPQSFLTVKQESGEAWAKSFLELKSNIDKPLSAILSLNTVAHTVGAAGVGAQAVKVFGEAYFGVVSGVLTIMILVITEIIPKTAGAIYWRELARFASSVIRILAVITYPLVVMSALITRIISRNRIEQSTSREELSALASIGVNEGIFTKEEYKVIKNLLRLRSVKVKEVMTPRVVVAVASERLTVEEFLKSKDYLKYSRIPVYSGGQDNITGYVIRQTVFEKIAEDQRDMTLAKIKREIVIVPNNYMLLTVWETLLNRKEQIALIVDEYGGMDGIVTMEDIIETLLGFEIIDEKDTITDMQQYARERWKTRQAKYSLLEQIDKPVS